VKIAVFFKKSFEKRLNYAIMDIWEKYFSENCDSGADYYD